MTDLAKNAEAYVKGKRLEWSNLVEIAIGISPKQIDRAAGRLAKLAGIGKNTVKKKIEAIRFKAAQGWDPETIKKAGQSETISAYVKMTVKARTEPLVAFPHRLTPPVRDAVQELCLRLCKVLAVKTYDEAFEFVVADYLGTDDVELIHRAGMVSSWDLEKMRRMHLASLKNRTGRALHTDASGGHSRSQS